jgi:FSR family fosmidomycin resistance protein-like MFS transporter
VTASLLQPLIGLWTDRRPTTYALSAGMLATLAGILLLAIATSLGPLLVAAALVGLGSAVFHPEASRIARLASGGRHGLAQSVFQVGGNLGSSLGPLIAALVILPRGRGAIGWFGGAALLACAVLALVGRWYGRQRREQALHPAPRVVPAASPAAPVGWSLAILGLLVFSKYVYLASLTNYYAFYLMRRFDLSARSAQLHLFAFLLAVAVGTVLGGPIGDRVGRKRVIWASILGVAPFALALPHVGLVGTEVLTVIIGLVLASAFSAILVFAQELVPGRVGLISGLFFGFAFGVAGISAAALGHLADRTSLEHVYLLCSFLPLLGIAAGWLPDPPGSVSSRSGR